MKRLFSLLPLFISVFVCSSCEVGNALMDTAHGFLYDYANNYVNRSGDQQLVDNWNNIKNDLKPDPSYAAATGSSIAKGDWKGGIINATGAGAVAAGVDEKYVALGESGITNWINGNKNAAVIDIAQIVSSASGVKGADQVFDVQRNINIINQEYRENIRNGMSKEEATQIRYSKIGSEIGNLWVNQEEAHNEAKREKARKKREMLRDVIMQRGYNEMEADYLSRCIDLAEVDANNPSSVNIVLDLYHIATKESSGDESFFDDGFDVPKPVLEEKPIIVEEVPTPQPIIDERANAVKSISKTVLNSYALNDVELSDIQKADLDQVADIMNKYEDIQIDIFGHTCNIGTQEVNQNIGKRRAIAAKKYLMSKGVTENRIQVVSRDFSEPVVENDTEEHRKQNRRVTFIVK